MPTRHAPLREIVHRWQWSGIVPCNITAENGAIRAGDLLLISSRAGDAMNGTDRSRVIGPVLSKALQISAGRRVHDPGAGDAAMIASSDKQGQTIVGHH